MKRLLVIVILASSVVFGQGSLPAGRTYDTPINVEVRAGITLGEAIRIIVRSAGLSVVVAQTPEVQARVTLDVKGKPFRQVWEGLFMGAAANLDYRVLPSSLIVVAPKNQIEAFARARMPVQTQAATANTAPLPVQQPPATVLPDPVLKVQIYPVEEPGALANLFTTLLPNAKVFPLNTPKALVVQATEKDHEVIEGLLAGLATKKEAEARAEPKVTAPSPASAPVEGPVVPTPVPVETPLEALLFPAAEGGETLAQAVTLRFKNAKVNYLSTFRVVLVQVDAAQVTAVRDFVKALIASQPVGEKPAEKPTPQNIERSLALGYAKAAKVIELVGKLIPESKEVTLAADERTNTVLMRGPVEAIRAIEKLVADLDKPIPQVDLQVRVEQLSTSNGEEIAAALEAALGPLTLSANPGQGNYGLGLEVGKTALLKLNTTLKALQSAGKGRSVIDSRFTVSSGETVNLLSGGTLLIPLTSNTTGGQNTNALQNVEFGLELKLTPSVIPGEKIQLGVSINLGSTPTAGPNNSTVVPKQQLTSNVLLSSGNSAVLGGIISVDEKESRSGVPILMDLPLLGALFSQKTVTFSQNHLLIIVTAVNRVPQAVTPVIGPVPLTPEPAPPQQPRSKDPTPAPARIVPPTSTPGFERDVHVGGQP